MSTSRGTAPTRRRTRRSDRRLTRPGIRRRTSRATATPVASTSATPSNETASAASDPSNPIKWMIAISSVHSGLVMPCTRGSAGIPLQLAGLGQRTGVRHRDHGVVEQGETPTRPATPPEAGAAAGAYDEGEHPDRTRDEPWPVPHSPPVFDDLWRCGYELDPAIIPYLGGTDRPPVHCGRGRRCSRGVVASMPAPSRRSSRSAATATRCTSTHSLPGGSHSVASPCTGCTSCSMRWNGSAGSRRGRRDGSGQHSATRSGSTTRSTTTLEFEGDRVRARVMVDVWTAAEIDVELDPDADRARHHPDRMVPDTFGASPRYTTSSRWQGWRVRSRSAMPSRA